MTSKILINSYIDDYKIYYMGNTIYDIKKYFPLIKNKDKNIVYKKRLKFNTLRLNSEFILDLKYQSSDDWYCYYLISKNSSSRLSDDEYKEIQSLVLKDNSSIKNTLVSLVKTLSEDNNVITDIPGIGGYDISFINKEYPNIKYLNLKDLQDLNIYKILLENKLNISKLSGSTVILLLNNKMLAHDMTLFMPRKTIPITIF